MKQIYLILIISLTLFSEELFYNPEKTGFLDFDLINESSGIIKSDKYDNLYWTHNDSGDKPRIFAVNSRGEIYKPDSSSDTAYKGLFVKNAKNRDWEDIAKDKNGNLIIAACGNNKNKRKDLSLIYIKERDPLQENSTPLIKQYKFKYPDQKKFPPKKKNFDCEAVFNLNNTNYFLTKHRSDFNTKLYRMDNPDEKSVNVLTYIDKFNIKGRVTAADISKDGSTLAVLTYYNIWLFTRPENSDNFFEGQVKFLNFNTEITQQCEAVCFDNDRLIITNEQRDIFQIPLKDFETP